MITTIMATLSVGYISNYSDKLHILYKTFFQQEVDGQICLILRQAHGATIGQLIIICQIPYTLSPLIIPIYTLGMVVVLLDALSVQEIFQSSYIEESN